MKYIKLFENFEGDNSSDSEMDEITRLAPYFLMKKSEIHKLFIQKYKENTKQQIVKDLLEYELIDVEAFERIRDYVEMRDVDYTYEIFHAIETDNQELLKDLLDFGLIDNYERNDDWASPFEWAIFHGNKDIVSLFLDYGLVEGGMFKTELTIAFEHGQLDIVKLLFQRGFDVNEQMEGRFDIDYSYNDEVISYPIIEATRAESEDLVKLLLDKGANPNSIGVSGCIALHFAPNVEIAKLLVEAGSDINFANDEEYTPLHLAVERKDEEVARFLLESGADKSLTNDDNQTAWQMASPQMKEALPELK